MRILITGGAGYVGCSLVEKVAKRKDVSEVIIYDNLSRKNYNSFTHAFPEKSKVRYVIADILDNHTLRENLKAIDVVYHLAAVVHNPESDIESHHFEQVNHWGSALVVDEITKSDVKKLIYLSSAYVHGQHNEPITEDTVPTPNSFYAYSKLRGEEQIARLAGNTEAYVMRSGSIYGLNACCRFDIVVNKLIFDARYYGKVAIHGTGEQIRPFAHMQMVTNGLTSILDGIYKPGTHYLVEQNLSVNQVLEQLRAINADVEFTYVNRHIEMGNIEIAEAGKPSEKSLAELQKRLVEFYKKLS